MGSFHKRGEPLLATLVVLALALTVPALAFAGFVTWRWVEAEQARLEADLQQIEEDLLARLDRTLAGHIATMQALASSPALDTGDLERFDRQARELLGLQGINIVLRDPGGQQRVNTRLPWGSPLPRSLRDTDREIVRSKGPRVSDLFVGAAAREALFSVDVPVLRDGELLHFLHASLTPASVADIIRQSGIALPYTASVTDRKGLIVARSERTEEFVGTMHPGFARATGDRGKVFGRTPTGVPAYASYQRSPLSGWLISVGVEQSAYEAPLRRSFWLVGGLAAALLALAAGASAWVGHRLLTAHRALAQAAEAVGGGAVIEAPQTRLRETNAIGEALASASQRLHDQAQALLEANQTLESRVEDRTRALATQASLLAQSEALYRLLADYSSDMIVRNRVDGTREYVSPACRRLLGYEPEEILGRPMTSIIHPDDQGRVQATHRSMLEENRDHATATYRMRRKDGRWVWVEANVRPVRDGSGIIQAVIGTMRDVSERQESAERLKESEARYRILAENATDMIVRADLDTTRRYVSPGARELLGYEPQELIGTKPLDAVHPDDANAYRLVLDSIGRGETDLAVSRQRYRRRDGSYVWTEANFRLIRDAAGKPTGYVAAVRDISVRQRQAEELQAAKETAERALSQAQHASRSKSDFLAAMSHEIRTPLNSIIGFTNLLLEEPGFAPEPRRRLELIQASGSALLAVVNDILDFSKIEANQVELDSGPLSVPALIDNTVSIIRGVAANKRLAIRSELDPALPPLVVGDSGRLRQILLNLMNNAVKFTNGGSVSVSVKKEGETPEGVRLRFMVTDTGIGIPKDKLGRLFERFSQVDSSISRRYGGTGLGLAISKRLVTLMGGAIGVESVEGEGSTFWFTVTLPIGREGEASAEVGRRAAAPLRPARILLVEDLDINQELAQAVLEGVGHSVDIAPDGESAIEAVQRQAYDVVLMDVQMPVMDGMTATRRIRALGGRFATLPIIAMTANVLAEQVARFRQAGMNDHVGKPFRKDELLEAINRHLAEEPATALPAPAPALDRGVFDGLAGLVGPQKAAGLLDKLERRLAERFDPTEQAARDPRALAAEAHAIVSSGGMLGFRALSEAAGALEDACRTGGPALAAALARAAAERAAALASIASFRSSLLNRPDAA